MWESLRLYIYSSVFILSSRRRRRQRRRRRRWWWLLILLRDDKVVVSDERLRYLFCPLRKQDLFRMLRSLYSFRNYVVFHFSDHRRLLDSHWPLDSHGWYSSIVFQWRNGYEWSLGDRNPGFLPFWHQLTHSLLICTLMTLFYPALGMGLCVAFIAFVRLPSLKVSTLLLTGLLIYDVFWVFFSSYIFNSNVMVKVATRPADNPVITQWLQVVFDEVHSNRFILERPFSAEPGCPYFSGYFSLRCSNWCCYRCFY